jgi:hypothetical protein
MAHWFKKFVGISRFVVTLGVTACVSIHVAYGQYSNQFQNNVNPELNWRIPAIHGQVAAQPQALPKPSVAPSQVQLVQHLEPTQTNALLPTVDRIDSPAAPTLAPPPVNGTRIAQGIPGPGASPNARIDTIYPESRPGATINRNFPGPSPVPAPNLSTLGDNSYDSIGGDGLTMLSPPGTDGKPMIECSDPREIGAPMASLTVQIDIDIDWNKMKPCSINVDDYRPRNWQQTCFQRNASMLCTSAAYFEDVAVERYGHSWGPFMQPVMSAAHFYGSVVFLPYKMGLTPPNECVYTLGYYRPGSCAPFMIDPIPLSLRAGVAQAGAVVGMVHLIP